MAGIERHEQVGDRGPEQSKGHDSRHHRLLQPVAGHEGNHHADRRGLAALSGHVVIRPALARGGRLHLKDARPPTRRTKASMKISGLSGNRGRGSSTRPVLAERPLQRPDTASSMSVGRGRAICEYAMSMQISSGSSNESAAYKSTGADLQ